MHNREAMSGEMYDESYFIRGVETGKSLYTNYRWLPELTIPMVQAIVDHCGIAKGECVLDFGCARGYLVKALRGLGYDAWGEDVSGWAIENCDEEIKGFVSNVTNCRDRVIPTYDWIIAKDVLEHIPYIADNILPLLERARKGLFVVVPLSAFPGGKYVVRDYEEDVTHCQRHTLTQWVDMFLRPGWRVEASYRVRGVKDNYAGYTKGNGFITVRRIEE